MSFFGFDTTLDKLQSKNGAGGGEVCVSPHLCWSELDLYAR